jgi:hypothetical protein
MVSGMKLSLGAVLFAAVVLAGCASGHRSVGPASSPGIGIAGISSGLMLDGTVRCTAIVGGPVQAGNTLDVQFSFHNVSKRAVAVDLQYGGMWLLVKSPDGTTYDSRVPFESQSGPRISPTPIAPGATKIEHLNYLRVRWEGPLRVTPGCGLTALRPVSVPVTSPGSPVSDSAAVKDVAAASGHLLDHCRPRASGVSVVGRIDPPSGHAPPMQARCTVTLRHETGFDFAQVLIVTPPTLRDVRVDRTYDALISAKRWSGNTEAISWQLVVTRDGATPVDSAEVDTSRSGGGMAPTWDWTGSKWEGPGRAICGGYGSSGGIAFISVCGR